MPKSVLPSTAGSITLLGFPQQLRSSFSLDDAPYFVPVLPATDYRVAAQATMNPCDFGFPMLKFYLYLHRYDLTGMFKSTVAYTMLAGDPPPVITWPNDAAGDIYTLGCIGVDAIIAGVERISNGGEEILSDVITIVSAQTDPLNLTRPVISGANYIAGTTISVGGDTWSGVPTPTIARQWRRDGVDIVSATNTTYPLALADIGFNISCFVYPVGFPTKGVLSDTIICIAPALVWPTIADSQWTVVETSVTTGTDGTTQIPFGTDAGGSAISYDSTKFDLVLRRDKVPIPSFAQVLQTAPDTTGSGTVDFNVAVPPGELRYHMLGFRLKSDTTQQRIASSTTIQINGVDQPYGTIEIQGIGSVPTPITPITALGTPTSPGFYEIAITAGECKALDNGTAPKVAAGNAFSANSHIALGVGCLQGHSLAISRALDNVGTTLSPANAPPCCGGFSDNVTNPFATQLVLMKYSPVWNSLTVTLRNRATAMMKVMAFSGAYVCADGNPLGNGTTIRGWPTTKGENQKTTVPNQSIQGPAALMNALAFFGGVTALNNVLAMTPAALRTELTSVGLSNSSPYDTMNWRGAGLTNVNDMGLGSDLSSSGPTDAQIVTGVTNPRWFTHTISEYHRILAMMTWTKDVDGSGNFTSNNSPFFANGKYGTDYKAGQGLTGITGTPVEIARGWGGNGLSSTGIPRLPGQTLGTQGVGDSDPPFMGYQGAPEEMFCAQDKEGKRASAHYVIEAMRSLVGAWLSLWVSGLLDRTDPDILAVLPTMNRGMLLCEYFLSLDGFASWDHKSSSGHYPQSSTNWQRHASDAALGGAAGGNLFAVWKEVLGPALGCGQVLKNGTFSNSDNWTGISGTKAVTGGKLVFTAQAAGVGGAALSPNVPMVPTKYYEVKYTVSGRTAGDVVVAFTGGTQRTGTANNSNATFTQRLQANVGNVNVAVYSAAGGASLSVDNLTVIGPYETNTVGGS